MESCRRILTCPTSIWESAGDSAYEGRGVIVRCPSGRRIWQATITLPDVGRINFIFDVIY